VAIAAVAALLVALPISMFGGDGHDRPGLGQVLRAAAAVAATQPAEAPPGPGQYFYARSREAHLMTVAWEANWAWSALAPSIRQTWIGRRSRQGSRRLRQA
jgi:hypothetical protein